LSLFKLASMNLELPILWMFGQVVIVPVAFMAFTYVACFLANLCLHEKATHLK